LLESDPGGSGPDGGISGSGGSVSGGGGTTAVGGGTSEGGGSGGKTALPCGTPLSPFGPCASFGEVECVAAHPECVPMYDDQCCPSCEPGASCADCVRFEFSSCAPMAESGCTTATASICGVPSDEGCTGELVMDCLGKGQTQCLTRPGCAWAVDLGCQDPETCTGTCRPVTEHSCGTSCEGPPPEGCPPGFHPEGTGGAYFNWCLPDAMCP
jgi:hypothetical protein